MFGPPDDYDHCPYCTPYTECNYCRPKHTKYETPPDWKEQLIPRCHDCGKEKIKKSGVYGTFWSCADWKKHKADKKKKEIEDLKSYIKNAEENIISWNKKLKKLEKEK